MMAPMSQTVTRQSSPIARQLKPTNDAASAHINPHQPTLTRVSHSFWPLTLNDQLGIGFDGQNLNFSIGNPPGIDRINIPQGINEGPINLTPRPGGGFDLSIQVPDQ